MCGTEDAGSSTIDDPGLLSFFGESSFDGRQYDYGKEEPPFARVGGKNDNIERKFQIL